MAQTPAVGAHYGVTDRKAQAGSAGFRGEEGIEYLPERIRGQARTRVADGDLDIAVLGLACARLGLGEASPRRSAPRSRFAPD